MNNLLYYPFPPSQGGFPYRRRVAVAAQMSSSRVAFRHHVSIHLGASVPRGQPASRRRPTLRWRASLSSSSAGGATSKSTPTSSRRDVSEAASGSDDPVDRMPSGPSRRGILVGAAMTSLAAPPGGRMLPVARADDLFCGYYAENQSVTPQWAFKTPWSEGFVDVGPATRLEGARTFLRILGDEKASREAGHLPVLCLHGGPGLGFKYMEACEVLGSEKRDVASYDQVGCGRSTYGNGKTPPPGTYTPELFAAELSKVREAGGLEKVHVVAHGWGGMLALDHVLGGNGVVGPSVGAGVASLTLIGTPPSYARLIEDRRTALEAMPADMREALLEGDAGGAMGTNLSPAGRAMYDAAMDEWIVRHESARAAGTCYRGLRLGGAGDGYGARRGDVATDAARASAAAVARDMTGGMMFSVGGALEGWDADAGGRLARLTAAVPAVKIFRGENDALSAGAVGELYDAIARADMKPRVFLEEVPGAGSCVHLDKSASFLEKTNAFIAAWDCNGERFCNDA